jgi:hypothetical protein
VVVDLWFIESKWRKRNVRLSREGAVGYKRYVLDAKEMLFLEKAPNLLSQ